MKSRKRRPEEWVLEPCGGRSIVVDRSRGVGMGNIVCNPPGDDCTKSLRRWGRNSRYIAMVPELISIVRQAEVCRARDWEFGEELERLQDLVRMAQDRLDAIMEEAVWAQRD